MTSTRRRDTGPELALRLELHRRGLRYRVDFAPLPGVRRRADIVFTRRRLCIFIDGCFWHGCPDHFTAPRTNADYWTPKINGNRERDADTDRRLAEAGWSVLRIWEHEDAVTAADRVKGALELDTPPPGA